MSDLTERIARLSPEKQALLAKHLASRRKTQDQDREGAVEHPADDSVLARSGDATVQEIAPRLRREPFPLSFAQERLWFLERWAPGNTFYNDFMGFRITGNLEPAALLAALTAIQQRHQVLRTLFPESEGGEPIQHRVDRPPAGSVVDLRALDRDHSRAALKRLAQMEAHRSFDLRCDLPLRATLIHRAPDDHALLIAWHHIATDEWSWGIFLRELATFYEAFRHRRSPRLAPLPIQYADFAAWQREQLTSERLERGLDFWRQTLADLPSGLDLPTDRPRVLARSPQGAQRTFNGRAGLLTDLEALRRPPGTTLFMVLLAAYQGLLAQLTGQRDVVVGTPVSGREQPQSHELIGIFLNLIVIRIRQTRGWTFDQLLSTTRQAAVAAYAHQDMPFEKLVQDLRTRGMVETSGHQPVFQTLFALQNESPLEAPRLPGVDLAPLGVSPVAAKYDWTLMLEPRGNTLAGRLKFDAHLFDGVTAQRVLNGFQTWLEQLIANPDRPLEAVSLLSPADRHQMLWECNDTAVRWPTHEDHFIPSFTAWVDRTPDATALIAGELQITYATLAQRSQALARTLPRPTHDRDVRIGICLERSAERTVALLAVFWAGGAYVPLDPAYPEERLTQMAEDADLQCVLSDREFAALAERIAPDGTCLEVDSPNSEREPRPLGPFYADQIAYVIYTSGSTGRPKGVAVSHRAMINRLLAMRAAYGLGPGGRILHKTPFGFDVSVWEIFWPLVSGASTVIAEPESHRDPGLLASILSEQRIGFVHFVPAMLRAFLDHPRATEGHGLERVFCGGESLPNDLALDFAARLNVTLENFYGPTETAIEATTWTCSSATDRGRIPIGRPEANTRCLIVDRHLRLRPMGSVGELVIGGVQLARGYLGRAAESARRFVPDPWDLSAAGGQRLYRTGDLVQRRGDGAIVLLGRTDHQVKIRGVRIELGEIETLLRTSSGIEDVAVVVHRQEGHPPDLVAFLAGAVPDPKTLQRHLRSKLPETMIPSSFHAVDRLPRSPNGKLDHRALSALAVDSIGAAPLSQDLRSATTKTTPWNSPSEEIIAVIWQEILGVDRVTSGDHFFELGGHSLQAIQVATRLAQVFSLEVPVAEVFRAQDLAELAQRLDRRILQKRGGDRPTIEPDRKRQTAPLSFGQERLWTIQQLDPSNTAYNLPLLLDIDGSLADGALAAALIEIERRHTLLRSRFPSDGGRPYQHIQPHIARPLPVIDLSALTPNRRALETDRWILQETATPFDLATGPVWRRLLIRRASEDQTLVLDFHHLVADGWSMEVLMREILELYRAALNGSRPSLPTLRLQYADYAAWQRTWLQGNVLATELDIWRTSLDDAPPLDLPVDRPRPAIRDFRGARVGHVLSLETTHALESLARDQKATLFMVLLTAFQTLIARVCGQRDVVVGFPTAGRSQPELKDIIGFFVNLLPLRAQLTERDTFQQILDQTRRATLEAQTRQDVPFEKLAKALGVETDPSRPPIVQAALTLQEATASVGELSGATVSPRGASSNTAKLELTLFATRGSQGLEWVAEYSTALFDRTTIERLLQVFCHALAGLPDRLHLPWNSGTWLPPSMQHQVLLEWSGEERNHTDARIVPWLLAVRADQTPDAVAVTGPDVALTFRDLVEKARHLGARLIERGVGNESIVALGLPPMPDLVVAAVAAWQAGAAYLPLDPSHPDSRLLETLEDSGTAVAVTDAHLAKRLAGTRAEVMTLDERPGPAATEPEAFRHNQRPMDLAYVIYTSGSTGRPKGVGVPHGGLANLVASQCGRYGLTAEDRATQVSGLAFDATVWEIWPTLSVGGSLHFAPQSARRHPEALRRWLLEERITLAFAATLLAEAMLSEPWTDRSALRILFTAGDRLRIPKPPNLEFELMNLYGPSENSVMATGDRVDEKIPGLPSIGRPIVGVQTRVIDPLNGGLCPPGVGGELHLGGQSLARGYLGRPGLTAACFIPDSWSGKVGARLYRTGDRVRHRADGRLDFLGRIDHQVKIRGVRIELGEVEARLRSMPDIREAVVVSREIQPGNRQLVAYVVPELGDALDDLRPRLRDQLPDVMIPTHFMALQALPVTPNGKVDRRALPPISDSLRPESESGTVPRDDLELALTSLWQDVLERPRVFIDEDFFDLGGHSVLAVRLMAQIETRFRIKLPMTALFELRTVTALADAIRRQDAPLERQTLVTIQRRAAKSEPPPLVAVHPVGGHVLCYQELARHLGTDRDILGLQAPEVHPDTEPRQARIADQATRYVETLAERLIPAETPILIGWSTGGWIAFEMAHQLSAAGHQVPLVALIDSVPPVTAAVDTREEHLRQIFVRDLLGGTPPTDLDLETWASQPLAEAMADLLRVTSRGTSVGDAADIERLIGLYTLFRWNAHAFMAYRPQPYAGTVELFLTSNNSAGLSESVWRPFAPQSLRIHNIPGDHYSLLREPHVRTLAEHLRRAITRATEAGS